MAKRRRIAPQDEAGLRINNQDGFIRGCEAALKNFVGKKVGHEIRKLGSREFCFFASGDGVWKRSDGDYACPVLYLHEGRHDIYWACISLEFERKPNDVVLLNQVCIKVLTGLAASAEKILRFRAEWDARSIHHAQPHWHVHSHDVAVEDSMSTDGSAFLQYLEKQVLEGGFLDDTSTDVSVDTSTIPAWPNSESLHLAMAAQWHEQSTNHRVRLDKEKFVPAWLFNCLTYIRSQLNHVFLVARRPSR